MLHMKSRSLKARKKSIQQYSASRGNEVHAGM
jgi:hypothetical protein